MRNLQVKIITWKDKKGQEHKQICIVYEDNQHSLVSFHSPEEAKSIGEQLIRLANTWSEIE